MSDPLALALSGLWVFLVVAVAEFLRRTNRVPFAVSRKLVHVGVGTWILPTTLLFESRFWAAAGPLVFVALNVASRRRKILRAVEEGAGANVGAVLFPISFVVLILGLWPLPHGRTAVAAGLLALAWGDAAAAILGARFGRTRYRVGEGWRSLEGSLAMFAVSAGAIAVACLFVGHDPVSGLVVAVAALSATLLEAVGRRGFDNLLIPIGTAITLLLLLGL